MTWTLFNKRVMAPEAIEAREIAARIAKKADEIMQRLLEYQQQQDPFMALMADLYTRDQVQKIYKGLNGKGPH